MTNSKRATLALNALPRHARADRETAITDLVANLLHLCDREGLDFEEITERALWHHRTERRAETLTPSRIRRALDAAWQQRIEDEEASE